MPYGGPWTYVLKRGYVHASPNSPDPCGDMRFYDGPLVAESISSDDVGSLIAAAPDLLAACKAVLDEVGEGLPARVWRRVRNAIDKAEGREP